MDDWRTKDELESKIVEEGWKVRKVKVDEGCYEVYGTTPEGQRGGSVLRSGHIGKIAGRPARADLIPQGRYDRGVASQGFSRYTSPRVLSFIA